jgi:hypothetical protein
MRDLVKFLVLSCGLPCAWSAISEGNASGHAENVTIVNLEDGEGIVILTFSDPLVGGPACAAQHKDVLVIANGNHSPDAEHARHAFSLGLALKVRGSGTCKKLDGYETLSMLEVVK